jgi:hypothetical protein
MQKAAPEMGAADFPWRKRGSLDGLPVPIWQPMLHSRNEKPSRRHLGAAEPSYLPMKLDGIVQIRTSATITISPVKMDCFHFIRIAERLSMKDAPAGERIKLTSLGL